MFEEYIPFIVGAGLFIGSIFSGLWKGKQEKVEDKHEIVSGVIQDNYSMVMMSEQLRVNKEYTERLVNQNRDLCTETERLRETLKELREAIKELAQRIN